MQSWMISPGPLRRREERIHADVVNLLGSLADKKLLELG